MQSLPVYGTGEAASQGAEEAGQRHSEATLRHLSKVIEIGGTP